MARFISKQKEEIGLSPDALFFRGEKKIDKALLRLIDYDADHLFETEVSRISDVEKYDDTPTVSWFNVDGLHDEEIMRQMSKTFDLDSLILSDVMDTQSRPKIHEYDNCLYLSLKMIQYDEKEEHITSENLVLIVKENLLISFQERKGDVFEPVRERIRKSKKRIRQSGTDYLAICLLDTVLDNYSFIISLIGEKIETLEDVLLDHPEESILEEINTYKREINYLRRVVKPCREMILILAKTESEYLDERLLVHMKDLQDDVNQANDSLDSYREILSDYLNIYHSTLSNRLNDTMKVLTVFSVIFIPLTFIAGIYGTNFDFLPELHFKYAYFIMWGVMIFLSMMMILYFKRKKWL